MDSLLHVNSTAVPVSPLHRTSWVLAAPFQAISVALGIVLLLVFLCAAAPNSVAHVRKSTISTVYPYFKFAYVSFFKPHSGDSGSSQQAALESFYKLQADAYDVTRKSLLRGREDMLAMAAAQLKMKSKLAALGSDRLIWVDIGGGTGYNIEAMSAFVSVPDFFSKVYLVDFSPSLCEIARKRFQRLGWNNVHVICQDARLFRLEEYELSEQPKSANDGLLSVIQLETERKNTVLADLITMSYSLSMIPDFHSVIDSSMSLLAPDGIIGVVDFYVQSASEISGKTHVGGTAGRHVNWLGRAFWRTWFEADRVNLDASRRDYLEYRFGTVLSCSDRNYRLGGIPYYLWIGKPKSSSSLHKHYSSKSDGQVGPLACSTSISLAQQNLSINLPLPPTFYQNQTWRLHYQENHHQHRQFADSYIYAFTWEDPRIDHAALDLSSEDEVLALTSAGDNILSYLARPRHLQPKAIHAVDLNPSQNHLLELKLAAFASLPARDIWKLFGLGSHPNFRRLLVEILSPHLSSCAFQFWLARCNSFSEQKGGLYATGGSCYALGLVRWLARLRRATADVQALCNSKTLGEQSRIWKTHVRKVLINKALSWAIVSQRLFLWKALGVPNSQRQMIVDDFVERNDRSPASGTAQDEAILGYMTETLDPVVRSSKLSTDNYFYLLCLQGQYTEICHPDYLSPAAYSSLSQPCTLAKVNIHTATLLSVIQNRNRGSLAAAIIMDSMDWFPQGGPQTEASEQIKALHTALRQGGKVLLRSAARKPWYLSLFEQHGFEIRSVCVRGSRRTEGEKEYVDRVNMYAGTYLCVKQ